VHVSDGTNTSSVNFNWTVTDRTAPGVINPGDQGNNEANTVSLQISASDPDNDPLTFTAGNLPAGLTIDALTGKIAGTISNQAAGVYAVTVHASDGQNDTPVSFTWTIGDITAPVVATPGPIHNNEGNTISLQINASDADNDPL